MTQADAAGSAGAAESSGSSPGDAPSTSPGGEPSPISGTLIERMGIDLQHWDAQGARGTMPVEGNTQPYGLLHGGASAVLAETLGSMAAASHAGADRIAVGIELSCTHHRAARGGLVHGVATALHRGNSLATYEIVITDDEGRRVCTSRLTCLIRLRPPGA